jgi:hypothetical protein
MENIRKVALEQAFSTMEKNWLGKETARLLHIRQ